MHHISVGRLYNQWMCCRIDANEIPSAFHNSPVVFIGEGSEVVGRVNHSPRIRDATSITHRLRDTSDTVGGSQAW